MRMIIHYVRIEKGVVYMNKNTTQPRKLGILEMTGKTEGLAIDQMANIWKAGEDLEVGADWENLAGLGTFSALTGGYSFWKLRQSLQAKAYFQGAYRRAITETIEQLPPEIRNRFTPKLKAQHDRMLQLRQLETELAKPGNETNNALKQQIKALRGSITKEINTVADDLIKEAGPLVGKIDASMVELIAHEDDVVRAAGNSRLGATVARLEETRALVRDVGHRRAARGLRTVLGPGEEALAKALQEGAEATAQFNRAKEAVNKKLVENPKWFGTRGANKIHSVLKNVSRRALPSVAGVACIMSIYAMIDNNNYQPDKAEALADLTLQMDRLNIKVKDAKLFTPEKRKQLVDWALKNTDDPQEKEMLQRLIACDYDFTKYLSQHRGVSFEPSFAHDLTKDWANEVMKLCQDGFNANFYTQLESRYAPSERIIDKTFTENNSQNGLSQRLKTLGVTTETSFDDASKIMKIETKTETVQLEDLLIDSLENLLNKFQRPERNSVDISCKNSSGRE